MIGFRGFRKNGGFEDFANFQLTSGHDDDDDDNDDDEKSSTKSCKKRGIVPGENLIDDDEKNKIMKKIVVEGFRKSWKCWVWGLDRIFAPCTISKTWHFFLKKKKKFSNEKSEKRGF